MQSQWDDCKGLTGKVNISRSSGMIWEPTPAATVYSIAETVKGDKLNDYRYLVHTFSKLPGTDFKSDPSLLEDFMPW